MSLRLPVVFRGALCALSFASIVACSDVGSDAAGSDGAFAQASVPVSRQSQLPPQGDRPPIGVDPFRVVSATIPDGATWQLNRPFEIEFNRDVDFATVSLATIPITDVAGAPVIGTFTAASPRRIRFQPPCPTDPADLDGALQPASQYRVRAFALNPPGMGTGVTVLSTAGEQLVFGLDRSFMTPNSTDPAVLFFDTVPGPPRVRVRGLAGEPVDSQIASFVEFGDGSIEFLEFDPVLQLGTIAQLAPLNLYSRPESQFEFVLRFDQALSLNPANIGPAFLRLEYSYDRVTWERSPAASEAIDNCTEIGATVRLRPLGVVPQGAFLRVALRQGFSDITGDALIVDENRNAVVGTETANPGSATPGDGSDEVLERFEIGGDAPGSLEDTTVPSTLPRANWSSGPKANTLQAAFDFGGTGGPGGDFDWVIRTGETMFLDTAFDQIIGGPNGIPTTILDVVGGVVDLDDFLIETGGRLIITGPNTATILATGTVVIEGEIIVDGGDSFGVGTLNTTNIPEPGASGRAGGGRGGTGSFLTSQSTPKGGDGNGAFDIPGLGGEGGETGYAPLGSCEKDNRRGAGGGGGRLGRDVFFDWQQGSPTGLLRCQSLVGMDAEPGFTGSPDGTGAISQELPARGGAMSPFPFVDGRDDNDFFGTKVTADGEVVVGELPGLIAGAGGGAGGDASRTATFPMTPFSPTGDEKGAGGGGGAGGLLMLAIGNIEVRAGGSVHADGGHGGGGENVVFFDRVGGGSGGGSGGHIVLSSASQIVIEAEATDASVGDFYNDYELSPVHERRPLRALGGQGGAGKDSRCGANEDGMSQWRTDAIPFEAFEGNPSVPPQNQNVWLQCNRLALCAVTQVPEGTVVGGGGDGGPGIIQLHVADPATQLLFPNASGTYGVDLDPTRSMVPPPFGWTTPTTPTDTLVPFFSAQSESYSKWIPLGLARLQPPNGALEQVELLFEGTDPADGSVLRNGSEVAELAPQLPYTSLSIGGAVPSVDIPTATFTVPAASFDDLYRRNAALTREFAVRLRDAANPATEDEFLVQLASFDPASDTFDLVVDPRGTALADLLAMLTNPEVEVVPFFFRVVTAGVPDAYPTSAGIQIAFDATTADPMTGAPSANPLDSFSGGDLESFATDAAALNAQPWDFVRFRVRFDIDAAGGSFLPSAPRPAVDFLRVPYRF
ncbi:MAG: Ig-like domain-containing protein [Planctomycetota bacterium]